MPNGPVIVHLKHDEHFHSGKPKAYRIYVNGQEKVVTNKSVTYAETVALAFPHPPTGPNIIYTVGYEDGPPKPVGQSDAGRKGSCKGWDDIRCYTH